MDRHQLPRARSLPNHPDIAYEFIKTLKDCGYRWVLVQEHTVDRPETGTGPDRKHLPHRLVCRNSRGEEATIVTLIKTQGSDTKLVARMQPYYEAKELSPWEFAEERGPTVDWNSSWAHGSRALAVLRWSWL
jgi:hypothetical protein